MHDSRLASFSIDVSTSRSGFRLSHSPRSVSEARAYALDVRLDSLEANFRYPDISLGIHIPNLRRYLGPPSIHK